MAVGQVHRGDRDPLLASAAPRRAAGTLVVTLAVTLGLAALSLLFWKLRILDPPEDLSVSVANADVFVGQAPMTAYAFEELRAGRLPLWNPYQLCGMPFLAVTYVGLFYPPNWLYLGLDVPEGIEVAFLLHMLLGALGMWVLVRRFGLGDVAGVASALTWVWSGFVVHWANQPQLFAGLAWAPWTLAATDAALRRQRGATAALALVVALQILNGAMEILLHTLYFAGGYALAWLAVEARRAGPAAVWRPGLAALGGVLLGVALSAVQLLPTLELVAQSARAPGELSFEELVLRGRLEPDAFARQALSARGLSGAGVLSLVALVFAAGLPERRALWAWCVGAGVVAVWLAFGGELFRLYTSLPGGDLFRRSYKFLDVYDFAQALLVGLAVAALLRWAPLGRRDLWRSPAWSVGVALALALAVVEAAWRGRPNPALVLLGAGLVAYGAVASARARTALVLGLVAVHAASLFFGVENRFARPIHVPDHAAEHAQRSRLDVAQARMRHERMYLSPNLWFNKQGLVQRVPVVADYEPLAPSRYAGYFETAAGAERDDRPFNGRFVLSSHTRWPMMDLTGTRFYVLNPWDLKLQLLIEQAADGGFVRVEESPRRVVERTSAFPRAWVVGAARVVADEDEVLATLSDPAFDPRAEVLLEERPAVVSGGAPGVAGTARLVSHAPEEVVLAVEAQRPGWLVLSDFHYPGWQARVDGAATPIARANSIFRAVPVPAGASEVRFAFQPASVRLGAAVSGLVGLGLAAGLLRGRRRRA